MKKVILSLLAIALIAASTFSAQAETKKVTKSQLTWKGYKVTGSHEGTVNLSSGAVVMEGGEFKGGTFTIDMTTLESSDVEGGMKKKLDGHLKSMDFFGIENYPSAKLVITNVKKKGENKYQLTGDMQIKGVTQSITFPATVLSNKATANLKIDRTKFNIKYGSKSFFEGLKDKAIYDEFDLVIDIQF